MAAMLSVVEQWQRAEAFDLGYDTPCMILPIRPRPDGYVHITRGRADRVLAHRLFYEEFIGPIGDGLKIDHLCRNRSCCNPWHLEPVTDKVNILRGEAPSARQAKQTHCKRGHALSGANLEVQQSKYHRSCRTCKKVYNAAYRKRMKEQRGREI